MSYIKYFPVVFDIVISKSRYGTSVLIYRQFMEKRYIMLMGHQSTGIQYLQNVNMHWITKIWSGLCNIYCTKICSEFSWVLFIFGDVISSHVTLIIQLRILFIVVSVALGQSYDSRGRVPEPVKYALSIYVKWIITKQKMKHENMWVYA